MNIRACHQPNFHQKKSFGTIQPHQLMPNKRVKISNDKNPRDKEGENLPQCEYGIVGNIGSFWEITGKPDGSDAYQTYSVEERVLLEDFDVIPPMSSNLPPDTPGVRLQGTRYLSGPGTEWF